ncbi:DUF1385 domain-containing protein [Tissierella carlieri]|uniref:DUF1385 domain-containing protein n=1 Tax=Tissierella carlieri TaxID=689904 RepID=A0ABT1SER8_9FIRM|nr:DUF1385 domain-containing protein [Tissierella carlieri]MCQ4924980.1 DUF1385 domain-containing protein [Tissierella carlieri]
MRIIGGSASYRGIIFESDTNVVNAKRIGKDIFISNRRKDKTVETASKIKSIPFIRGIWVLMEVFLSAPKGFLITILAMGMTLTIFSNTVIGTSTDTVNMTFYIIAMICLPIGIIRFSNLAKYHGAEHKVFNAYLNNKELTIENVKKESRISADCGSNLAVFFILINLVFLLTDIFTLYSPILSWTLAYELFIMGNKVGILKPFRLIAGLFQKYLLTAEPNDSQIEVGIAAIKELLK